ncbi:MAG: hypothetical protein ACI85U_003351, partial [Candidatus Promineifilaceae bacterium]
MTPTINNPNQIKLPNEAYAVIAELFSGYKRVILQKTFTDGLSGGQVIKVQGIRHDGIGELPAAVKIAPISQIEKELKAFKTHIHNRLFHVAYLTSAPVKLEEIGWGGLRYALMGGEKFEITTLLDYLGREQTTADDVLMVLDYLMRTMYDLWGQHSPQTNFSYSDSYSQLLPVHYRISHLSIKDPTTIAGLPLIEPGHWPIRPFNVSKQVRVSGLVINKINLITNTITLQDPTVSVNGHGPLIRLWFPSTDLIKSYRLNQPIVDFTGVITETRQSRLELEVKRFIGGSSYLKQEKIAPFKNLDILLANPLYYYEQVLEHTCQVKVASIHGDLNLGNVIVEPERRLISLIDFSESRQDYVLHDLMCLEREVITRLLPKFIAIETDLSPIAILAYLYGQLHLVQDQTILNPPAFLPPSLQKCWAILSKIRQEARYYLCSPNDYKEYYRGLFLYLLGALKFKNLTDSWSKKLAFWGAAFIYQYLTVPEQESRLIMTEIANPFTSKQKQLTLARFNKDYKPQSPVKNGQHIEPISNLPDTVLPPPRVILPPGSRMPLGRNPAFTGRQDDLKWIASAVKKATAPQ